MGDAKKEGVEELSGVGGFEVRRGLRSMNVCVLQGMGDGRCKMKSQRSPPSPAAMSLSLSLCLSLGHLGLPQVCSLALPSGSGASRIASARLI